MKKEEKKKIIQNAMLALLKEKKFDDISVMDIVKRAGISRSSFYTYYQDKYDILDAALQELFSVIQYIFQKHHEAVEPTMHEVFELLSGNDFYAILLSENGSIEIHNYLRARVKRLLEGDNRPKLDRLKGHDFDDNYIATYFSHAVFGLIQAWILQGRRESPDEMTRILMLLIGA